jgi:hypothetical protein
VPHYVLGTSIAQEIRVYTTSTCPQEAWSSVTGDHEDIIRKREAATGSQEGDVK